MNTENKGIRWSTAALSADELLKGETIEYTVREEIRDSVNLARTDELWRRSVRTAWVIARANNIHCQP